MNGKQKIRKRYGFAGWKRIAVAFCLLAAGSVRGAEEVIFSADFNRPESVKEWKLAHWHTKGEKRPVQECSPMRYLPSGGMDRGGCVEFQADDPACNTLLTIPLDPKKTAGRGVILEGWMQGENLTAPKVSYLGPKLMLAVTTPQSADHPDQMKTYGSYGWKKFTAFCRVSPSVRSISVNLGLQGCTGKVRIDNVRVFLEPLPPHSDEPLKGQLPPNKTTRYRGVMSGHDLSEEAFRELREVWNANLLRFQISRPDGWDNTTVEGFRRIVHRRLKELDRILPLARKYGIKVVIDMHVGPGTKVNQLLSNALSWEPEMQQALVDVWREIAARYKGDPVLYGYDLLNEPREENYVYKPGGGLSWNRLADRIARAIREIDPKTPIVIEPHNWGGATGLETFQPIHVPNVIYSIHNYNPGAYTHQGVMAGRKTGVRYPGMINGKYYDRKALEEYFRPAVEFQKKYNVPIYVGEFGVARWAPNAEQWLEDMISIFEKYGWDWTYHSYREWDGWSAEHSSDPKDHRRIGDTPRRRVLLRYMSRNPRMVLPPKASASEKSVEEGGIAVPEIREEKIRSPFRLSQEDGRNVISLRSTSREKDFLMSFPVDPARIAGKNVSLCAEIRQKDVTPAPKEWQGIKLMLFYEDAGGKKQFPQAKAMPGSSDWRAHAVHVRVPAGIRKAEILIGMEHAAGEVAFRKVRIEETKRTDYRNYRLTGTTGRKNAEYQPGEPMVFQFRLLNAGKAASGTLQISRVGDDGKTETKLMKTSPDGWVRYTSSLSVPGYVMVKATLLDPYGAPAKCDPNNVVQFGLGAGVRTAELEQGVPEPADFDAFWEKCRKELEKVPVKVLERKEFRQSGKAVVWDVKVACAGPRPVSGYLAIPKGAAQKSCPLVLHFDGYGVRSAPVIESAKEIHFSVNAHGVDNGHKAHEYNVLGLGGYGFRNAENENPDTVYFKYMILRDLRALEYAKTLPEWDGKTIRLEGGSQGAFQTVAVAALSSGITSIRIAVPWFCDLGGVTVGRVRGWRPDYRKALNYYDTVNFARRVKCPVRMNAGLSDYVCPPSGTRILYRNFRCPVTADFYQGLDHRLYPGFLHHTAEKVVYRK